MGGVFFSIIIPVFNVKEYLNECIDSVINNKFIDYEIILVDDGSSDGSSEICDEYENKFINVKVIHQLNQGHTVARINGFKKSSGKYILFIDSDDFISNNYLSEMYESIVENDYPDFVQCEMLNYYSSGETSKVNYFRFENGKYSLEEINKIILPKIIMDKNGDFYSRSLCAKAIKKELIFSTLLHIPIEIKTGEDMCTIISLLLKVNSICIIDKCTYYYRYVNNSISKNKDKTALKRVLFTLHYVNSILKDKDKIILDQYNRLVVQQVFSACIRVLMESNLKCLKKEYQTNIVNNGYQKIIEKADCKDKKLLIKKIILSKKLFFLMAMINMKRGKCGRNN